MRKTAAVLLAIVLLAGACTTDDGGDAGPSTTTTAPADNGDDDAPAEPADVTVTGPITGGERGVPYNPAPPDLLEEAGYVEEEFFVAGRAAALVPDRPLTPDGVWDVQRGEEADYRTRIIVRRPADADDFDGTVLVEWLNVSAGRDSDPDWGFLHPYLLREGWAYVGVSAQATGVEGGGARLEVPGVPADALAPLREWDPARYGELDHPGDQWSYGIFSDVGELLRAPGEVDPSTGCAPST